MWHTSCCMTGLRVMVILSQHDLIPVSLSHSCRTLSKTPSSLLEEPQELTFAKGILVSDSTSVDTFMPVSTLWGAAGISSHLRECRPSWTGWSSEAGGNPHAHLAHSHLFSSTLPSVPGTILVRRDSRSGKDLHMTTVSPREPFVYQQLQTAPQSQSALARQGHASWGHTSCLLDFKRGGIWLLYISSGPSTTFLSSRGEENKGFFPFSIHRWLLAVSSHSLSHTEWKNTSESGATGSKLWDRLCWNISFPGKMTTMAQHEHIFAIMCLIYFVVGLPVTAKET